MITEVEKEGEGYAYQTVTNISASEGNACGDMILFGSSRGRSAIAEPFLARIRKMAPPGEGRERGC